MNTPSPLNVSQTDSQRIFVGLGWDPNDSPTLIDKVGALIGRRESHHDLDLACYYFNQDGACLGYISADVAHATNASGSIYHSGDSIEGVGDGDDEQISVELKNLPPNVHHLIFKASIKSGHHFGEVAMPEIRLCDGYTERVFLDKSLEDGGQHNGYIFARVFRGGGDGEWMLEDIGVFSEHVSAQAWADTLAQYL
ncbi:MAG: TerD family protein [Alphaproteobacteria bacterium]|nr:TerD family protein [Alphaproteobacteria bacterium]